VHGHVETAAYFVVAEALTNIAKYAGATKARVTVARKNSNARIEIRDDGNGGATPDHGSGLRGLADRVGDGQLTIESSPGQGTRIIVEIPCAAALDVQGSVTTPPAARTRVHRTEETTRRPCRRAAAIRSCRGRSRVVGRQVRPRPRRQARAREVWRCQCASMSS
jgi:hypothetical protein